jgi:AraC-like DNA-binding protein
MVVRGELEKLGLKTTYIELGLVKLEDEINAEQKMQLDKQLQKFGFSILDTKKSQLIERIKNLITDLIQEQKSLKTNLSDYLSDKLNYDYNYLSNQFTEVEGSSIEKYYIAQKIEKAKELIVYDEMSLSEIAFVLQYSSISHLSSQFKKVTGLSPGHFKKLGMIRRKNLDEL